MFSGSDGMRPEDKGQAMKRNPVSVVRSEALPDSQASETPLTSLYMRWRMPVMRMLRRYFRTTASVEDAAQEVFVRMAATGRVLEPGQEQPYLRQTVRSVAARDWQKSPEMHGLQSVSYDECREELLAISAEGYGDTEHQAEHRQRLTRLHEAIQELPPRQREAFIFHRIEGHTIEETADRMGIGARMVVKHLGRAVGYCETRVLFTSAAQMKRLQALQEALSTEEDSDEERAVAWTQGQRK
ncbi:RNA polymerase sigma factor [Comamonas composti]|uniref:RNA polymerase sigma factor n=1 Tax=Comamonas composti TaxID=408558 RepID=UPI001FE177ED|nr:RNA polymerase sigma factor [Comamonas composti]